MHALKRKEIFKTSLRKLIGPPSQMLKTHNYLIWKIGEENGVDHLGVYVVDDKSDDNSYCNKKMSKSFRHQSSVIQKILDSDYIDTENTDFTYIDDFESEDVAIVNGVPSNNHVHSTIGDITIDGKIMTVYHTEIMSDSNTAPESI